MFADVLILQTESNIDHILTYSVEEWMKVETGMLVSVPIRQKFQKGLVFKFHHNKPEGISLKPIKEILSEGKVLSLAQISLAEWISTYYVCSLNKVIQLFLPPPIRLKEKIVLQVTQKEWDRLFVGKIEQQVLASIKDKQITPKEIIRLFGLPGKLALDYLLKNKIVSETKVFQKSVTEKTETYLRLSLKAPSDQDIIKKAPRQRAVLKALAEGEIMLSTLKESLGKNVSTTVKALVEKGWICTEEKIARRNPFELTLDSNRPTTLNSQQQHVSEQIIKALKQSLRKNWLLYGVTGSGKTEVYLKAIEETLKMKRQVLYLVPEIALTPQITSLLLDAFGSQVALLHSALTPGERYDEWTRIKNGKARVILGPRSAVFAPFEDLGLVIIDEEHEGTYKQNEPDPRYDARKVAQKLAELYDASIIMGSATPSLESYLKAHKNEYELIKLPQRVDNRPLPVIRVIDLRNEMREGHQGIFSRPLINSLKEVIVSGKQAILFLNRRGFHTCILCRECGHSLTCPHCAITMTYHKGKQRLVCHYCNHQERVPLKCPSCGSGFIKYSGSGTERVAEELVHLFPDVSYLRMDADTTQNKGSHSQILKAFQEKKAQVLIGTQMIAKGLDFPCVTLVGVIQADSMLNMPDFQAGERAYQMLTQVAGRCGRGDLSGEVLIQTFDPEQYLFEALIKQNYDEFYHREMTIRKMLQYPPYYHLLRVLVTGFEEKKVLQRVDYFKELLTIEIDKHQLDVEALGPSAAPLSFLRGRFRHHFILKGKELSELQHLAHTIRQQAKSLANEPRIILDIQPQNLL